MLTSSPFLLALKRQCASSVRSRFVCVHAKAKTRNQQKSDGRKECKGYMKRHKSNKHNIHGKESNKDASKQARRPKNKKGNKRWCLRGTNVGFDRMSITSLC